jgi:hypothetical protein
VPESDTLKTGRECPKTAVVLPGVKDAADITYPQSGVELNVLFAVSIENPNLVMDVVAAGVKKPPPVMSQSPAVKEMLVIFAITLVVSETAEPTTIFDEINSPMLPADALPFPASPGNCPLFSLMSFAEFVIPVDSVNAPVLPAIDETEPADATEETATFFKAPDAA